MARNKMDKEWLYEQYITCGRSTTDIAEDLNKDPSTIAHWLRKYNIPRRPVGSMSQERILKNRVEVYCSYCGSKILKSHARAKRCKQHFCKHECSEKWHSKENNANYKGFRTDQTGRTSFEYRQWRKEVLKRDQHTCQNCGNKNNLHVHHLLKYSECEDLRVDIDNGVTLCKKCHYEAHK